MLLKYLYGTLLLIFYTLYDAQGVIIEGPSTVIYFPGQTMLPIELICNVTGFPTWDVTINGEEREFTPGALTAGDLGGHNISGSNILISVPVNNSRYVCISNVGITTTPSDPAFLYIAAVPDQVPDVDVINDSVTIDDEMFNLTLSWGEPFNNFDPIVNYTVSCLEGDQCPQNFTTTDNTTTSYPITGLLLMTNYTFSVVATNSLGSGMAGVTMINAPSLPGNVTGVMLDCEAVDTVNQCTVEWEPITVGNGDLDQPLVYEVYYNGMMKNITSPTTELTFNISSLPDGVLAVNITVTVTAINRFGNGTPSDPESAEILAPSVVNATTVITPEDDNNETYSLTVTCTIHSESDADTCEVMAVPTSGQSNTAVAIVGSAQITNGMATVTVEGLKCGVTYDITAGGILNGALVGPRSSHGTVMGDCSIMMTPTTTLTTSTLMNTTSSSIVLNSSAVSMGSISGDDSNTGAIVGGVVGGVCGAILLIVLIILLWFCCIRKREAKSSRATSPGIGGEKGGTGVKVHTLDRYGKPIPLEGENTDTGVELTGYTAKSPEFTVSQVPSTAPATTFQGNDYQTDEKNRTPSAYVPEGSYDTLAPAEEPTAPSAEVVPPSQNGQSNPNAPKLNYADLEQFTRKPASVKKPEPQPASQYAVIDPKSLQQGTYT